jgi:hypothetical protein
MSANVLALSQENPWFLSCHGQINRKSDTPLGLFRRRPGYSVIFIAGTAPSRIAVKPLTFQQNHTSDLLKAFFRAAIDLHQYLGPEIVDCRPDRREASPNVPASKNDAMAFQRLQYVFGNLAGCASWRVPGVHDRNR